MSCMPKTVVMAHHNTLESVVVRSGGISYEIIATTEDPVCLSGTGTFRPWTSYAKSFNRQLSFQRGGPSQLSLTLVVDIVVTPFRLST